MTPSPPPPPKKSASSTGAGTAIATATSLDDAKAQALALYHQSAEKLYDIKNMSVEDLLTVLVQKNTAAALAAPGLIAEAAAMCKRYEFDPSLKHVQIVKFGNDNNDNGGFTICLGQDAYQFLNARDKTYAYAVDIGPVRTVQLSETETDQVVSGTITKTEIATGNFVASATVEVWMSEYRQKLSDGTWKAQWKDPPQGKPKSMLRKVCNVQLRRAVSELSVPTDIEFGDINRRPLGIQGGVTIAGEEIPTTSEGDTDNADS